MTKPRRSDPEALIRARQTFAKDRAFYDQMQARRDDPRRLVRNPCGEQECEACYGDPEVAAEIRENGGLPQLRQGAYIGVAHRQTES
jgi:hypothetical protein